MAYWYVHGLIAARDAYRYGGSPESLEPVKLAITQLESRSRELERCRDRPGRAAGGVGGGAERAGRDGTVSRSRTQSGEQRRVPLDSQARRL